MTRKLFSITNKLIISLWLIVLWLSAIPDTSFADYGPECNQYWAKCGVEDINTIHTKDESVSSGLLDTIKNAINWILWILATVALCVCIYWGFKMLTSWWDSKWYDAGRKVLKNAAIWLAIILLSWMIVSVVFWFVSTLSQWNQTKAGEIWPIGW
jgi:hypothetical protein